MMYKRLFYFLYSLCVVYSSQAQSIKLKFSNSWWDIEKKHPVDYRIGGSENIDHTDSIIHLKSGESFSKYQIHFLPSYYNKKGKAVNLGVFIGIDKKNNIVVVVDKNFNHDFSDDTVYQINMQKRYRTAEEFFNAVPLIAIDSLQTSGNSSFTQFLKVAASPISGDFFEDSNAIKNINRFYTTFYLLKAYSASFSLNRQKFETVIVNDPWMPNSLLLPKGKATVLMVFKALSSSKDTCIYFGYLDQLTAQNKKRKAFTIEGKSWILEEMSTIKPCLSLKILPKATENNHFDIHNSSYSLSKKRYEAFDSFPKYTVIEFSGSWCKPCRNILPRLKQTYNKNKFKINFITVLVENDLVSAERYYKESAIDWEVIYEDLNCSGDSCLATKLKVFGFPTFILVDKKGTILFHETGSGALERLKVKLTELPN